MSIKSKESQYKVIYGPRDYNVSVDLSVADLIEKQVKKTPFNVAYKIGDLSITYKEFNEKANFLASLLIRYTKYEKKLIPVIVERCIELPIILLAIMKVGCAFVPVDIYWPTKRINEALETLGNYPVCLCKKNFVDIAEKYNLVFLEVDYELLGENEKNIEYIKFNGDDPIYAIFTSGTSGKPKAAVNLHKGIVNRFLHMNKRYNASENDVVLLTSNHVFDASIWQLLWPQINGFKTIIPMANRSFELMKFINLIEDENVTITDFVPSVFNLAVDMLDRRNELFNKFKTLRYLLIGGEAMNPKYINKFLLNLPECQITNTYGPSETAIGVVFYDLKYPGLDNIPIGKPIDNVDLLILDDNQKSVAQNEEGELYLGGICVGAGYVNENEKTEKNFLSINIGNEKRIFYKTGDKVKLLLDGNLMYIGRIDRQIKISGVRVELSEIESKIMLINNVKDVVVVDKRNNEGKIILNAYLILYNQYEYAVTDIKNELATMLPIVMQPDHYIILKQFPVNRNGKVDFKHFQHINNNV